VALSGYFLLSDLAVWPVIALSVASALLYAGGVVMNDVCDAGLDAAERPERPIPSGRVSKKAASVFGMLLLTAGVAAAACAGIRSGMLALLIAGASLLYDRWGKHHLFFGPLNMGICRGLDLLLGMSILSLQSNPLIWTAVVPVIYIAAVTLVSRGEVHGGKRSSVVAALVFYMLVILSVGIVGMVKGQLPATLFFLALFAMFIFPPLLRALKTLSGKEIGKAVKAGVLGIVLMNASWAAAGAGWPWAVATALLLPVSVWIAGKFAVT
jgi:4-hydroxybenzoate polyprenyltransferase